MQQVFPASPDEAKGTAHTTKWVARRTLCESAGVQGSFPTESSPGDELFFMNDTDASLSDLCTGSRRQVKLRHVVRGALTLLVCLALPVAGIAELDVRPARVTLDRPEATQQLLVSRLKTDRRIDCTHDVRFSVRDPDIVILDERGTVAPLRDGETEIEVRDGDTTAVIPVTVRGLAEPSPISFEHEVIPILTKARCNSGGCHGKAEGKNGFKLSVFGFDPRADYEAIALEGRSRRLFPSAAERSLLLRKATAEMPHGGGRKFDKGSLWYRCLLRWISEGAEFSGAASPVARIEVAPADAVLFSGEQQQLQVTATSADGRRYCVTVDAEYESNATLIVQTDDRGLIHAGNTPGEATILVRYMGHVGVCRVTSPRRGPKFSRPPETNFIDRLVWDKLHRLGIEPSDRCDDATFLRRVFLDTSGRLPTVTKSRLFLESKDSDRRAGLIDELLEGDAYADYWAMRWSDVLRVDRDKVKPQGAVGITRWLRRQFMENRPWNEFVRDIITAQGDTYAESPASVFTVLATPEDQSRSFSQLFLGVRIECAQCHHHPFEKWGQDDYFGLAGFFTGVRKKNLPGGNQSVLSTGGADLKHPRTGELITARALGAAPASFDGVTDRRRVLADWVVSRDNPFFARAIVNRIWAHYLGRGLVEPMDDLRETNPATNEPLLQALAEYLHEVNFDLKQFTRTLLMSRVYQLDSTTNASNASDEQNFSHARAKPMPAEVLLDAICQATDVPEKFPGLPKGYRAVQVWDNRMPSYFFTIFGRPVRASVCECERSSEPSIAQALHLMNSPDIAGKIRSPGGRVARLADTELSSEKIVTRLCLATLSRFPTVKEQTMLEARFAELDRRAAAEDVLWILLNSKEFMFNH